VKIDACEGRVHGAGAMAWSKTTPRAAKRLISGVVARA